MDSPHRRTAAIRRGSYDDAEASLRPAQTGDLLMMNCNNFRDLSMFELNTVTIVTSQEGVITAGIEPSRTTRPNAGYRLKHRVNLEDIWLYGFEDEPEDEEGPTGDIDLRVTAVLAWALTVCLVCFRTMAKTSALPKQLHNQEDKQPQPIDSKWKLVRKLRTTYSFSSKARRSDNETKTQLFGQPLCKICPDDSSLPKPIAEILMLLRKRGPSTEGVFRKPGNSKNMKDIREQLNSGLEVDMESQPVVMLVALLKNFLKEIPGSLLVAELYDSWMTALDNEDNQQRAVEVKKVVDTLPGANKLLLQHLVCILHHIIEKADINKMDACNLAVCIAPTLLQLDGIQLDEQKEKNEKITELTQFLIENCEILGDNIINLLDTDEDSLSSQHHDSAYDSTDPDGDGEAGECAGSTRGEIGSSSSLSPSFTNSSWPAEAIFDTKPGFNRRCSEPIILLTPDLESVCSHARSHDDCSVERRGFEEQPLKKQISDDSFLLRRGKARPVMSFPRLSSSSSNMDPLPYMSSSRVKDSCSSLESAASNQSEGSVFTSSPVGSPGCTRRASTNQPQISAKVQQEITRPITDEKRRSQSLRVPSKVLMRTRSLGAFGRSSLKKDSQKENSFPCETLQEDSQSEADSPAEPLHKSRPLSAIEVFKHVDSKLPCRPPSY
ncbi:T-cell activation Rho GTPase-activating protein [Nibea albiflora]|uniref:T-cell activation Rho GTPase-activating protein n=1 Tax=Nibea albiflora TaxID=240163 RepID=A0ACB7FBP1_NIBAL|nr:T-cell activation Rho GTPase-activating protein [Nibea albiflora]